MDAPSQADSSVQGSEGTSWAPMGGNVGEGGFHATEALPGSNSAAPGNTPYNNMGAYGSQPNGYPPQQQQQQQQQYPPQQQQQPQYGGAAYGGAPGMTSPPPAAAAPPPPGSYAARSAQAHATQTMHQPSVAVTPAPAPAYGAAPAAGGYAARSAQAYATTNNNNNTPSPYGGASGPTPHNTPAMAPAGSYAARSQQAYATNTPTMASPPPGSNYGQQPPPPQQQQQQQQSPYGISNTSTYQNSTASVPNYATTQSQQQPQQPQRSFTSPGPTSPHAPTTTPSQQQQQPSPAAATGGYAARAAQAHATAQQQPPSTVVVNSPYGQQAPPPSQPPIPSPARPPNAYSSGQSVSNSTIATHATTTMAPAASNGFGGPGAPTPHAQAVQQRLLTDATRKVQEHAYYMRQAMDQNNLPAVLERAAYMTGELGVPPHGAASGAAGAAAPSLSNTGISVKLTPKNYYELYMRALEDMPSFEDYLLGLAQQQAVPPPTQQQQPMYGGQPEPMTKTSPSFSMRELYDSVQYCPRVLSRLYLQISAGSALIRSGETAAKWVLNDLGQCVKCEQNPIRGLFLRNYLLTVLRDKLPDTPESDEAPAVADPLLEAGNVKDSYEFVMENFMEMNKLWVRLQHLPGDGNTKEVKKRRERERNDLRILVGTNLVRISQLEGVTSQIYGEHILPRVLDHVVVVGDPLSQAYLMDCLVQVFPDEYHIETLPILLNVCPRLRDKVNIRTILQGLMDRLANYLADEELLDESDTNQVKLTLARDSFGMFEECVQKVYNARGPKLTSKEVIRLQTALLQFSLKCYPGNMEQIAQCMGACVSALQQANASFDFNDATVATMPKALDDVSVAELEKLLSIPLESLALRVLELDTYVELVGFLPWANRRAVAMSMLEAVDKAGAPPKSMKEIQQLFTVIEPLMRSEHAVMTAPAPATQDPTERATSLMAGLGVSTTPAPVAALSFGDSSNEGPLTPEIEKECALVSKLVQLLNHENTDVVYEMLSIAREQIRRGSGLRGSRVLVSVVFSALQLVRRIHAPVVVVEETKEPEVAPIEETKAKEEETTDAEPEATAEGKEEKPEKEEETEKVPEEGAEGGETEKEEAGDDGEDKKDSPTEPEDSKPATDESVEQIPKEEKKAEEPEAAEAVEPTAEEPTPAPKKVVTARQVFIFIQETVALIGKPNAEIAVKLFLEVALVADSMAKGDDATLYAPVAYELLSQSYALYEERISDPKSQLRCVTAMIGTLLTCKSLSESDYETLITKTAQFSAKLTRKADQCQMVAECAHLFFPAGGSSTYSNPQRALECLQRSLKLADAATSSNASNMYLFVDLMEHYMYFLEKKNPVVGAQYVTGLAALVKEYLRNATDARAVSDAKHHFIGVVKEIQRKKAAEATAELFAPVEVDTAGL